MGRIIFKTLRVDSLSSAYTALKLCTRSCIRSRLYPVGLCCRWQSVVYKLLYSSFVLLRVRLIHKSRSQVRLQLCVPRLKWRLWAATRCPVRMSPARSQPSSWPLPPPAHLTQPSGSCTRVEYGCGSRCALCVRGQQCSFATVGR